MRSLYQKIRNLVAMGGAERFGLIGVDWQRRAPDRLDFPRQLFVWPNGRPSGLRLVCRQAMVRPSVVKSSSGLRQAVVKATVRLVKSPSRLGQLFVKASTSPLQVFVKASTSLRQAVVKASVQTRQVPVKLSSRGRQAVNSTGQVARSIFNKCKATSPRTAILQKSQPAKFEKVK